MRSQEREFIVVPNKGDCGFDCAQMFYSSVNTDQIGFNMRKILATLIQEHSATLIGLFRDHDNIRLSFEDWLSGLQIRGNKLHTHVTKKVGQLKGVTIDDSLRKMNLTLSNAIDLLVQLTYWSGSEFCKNIFTDEYTSVLEAVRNLYVSGIHFNLMVSFGMFDAVVIFSGKNTTVNVCETEFGMFFFFLTLILILIVLFSLLHCFDFRSHFSNISDTPDSLSMIPTTIIFRDESAIDVSKVLCLHLKAEHYSLILLNENDKIEFSECISAGSYDEGCFQWCANSIKTPAIPAEIKNIACISSMRLGTQFQFPHPVQMVISIMKLYPMQS